MDQQGAIDSDPATKYGNNSTFVINISLSYAKARYYSEILKEIDKVGPSKKKLKQDKEDLKATYNNYFLPVQN